MTRPSDPYEADAEALIAVARGLQVDLSLLADWIACNPDPFLKNGTFFKAFGSLRAALAHHMPFVRRH
jgi:hypothetical protein